MSCDGVNCSDALEQLWALLDRELDEAAAARVREHLDRCQTCYPQYDFHRAYREFVTARCRHDAPAGLRRRIFMALLREEEQAL